ncbi:flagellar basal body L-ring protein FlgH [Massilia antarctica]|uniref:flagellar basal body L-ring protein FlgH n=1 Tax=Massilia antarctica TaxID=2765360 RepID=UPI0006BB86DC|nr:flagellar basal body L-ring protein FlgH [Massilia sp. H27-R4]MCY0911376.1 flagellar basal body L-ring protein FlgH [Massilia sp. H27-R4]CUI05020.1 Flagellar L-ring protein FlgH [Janthinobacterium sp. CG23_2]CUU28806.1 Flagellar L-ring protein FlgH [Janthinobacterium sp. CG23_2]
MKSILIVSLLALAGCAATPSSIVQRPTSARPLMAEESAPANGAIYQSSQYRPLFEDRRARHIGDMLTINITEKTSAVKAGASSGNKSGSANFAAPGVIKGVFGASVGVEGANKFSDSDNQSASNTFTGTIGVTVTEVLPNGNLIVAGEKQVAMNKGIEFIRFSGMVSPDNIGTGNTVSSTQVADARVEYRTNSQIDRAEMTAMVSRFFQSLLPF